MTMAAPSAESVSPAEEPDPEVPERARQRRYSAAYKVRVLNEYEGVGFNKYVGLWDERLPERGMTSAR